MKENMIPTVTPKEISEKIKQFSEAISTETKPIYINVVSYDKECMDINQLEIVVFHVTTNGDECAEIKKNGLKDLKMVLQEKTELSTFLYERGIRFDIPSKSMYVNDKAFDIDYSKYTDLDSAAKREEALHKIGHKIFYDFQVNGFLFSRDIYDYGTIHKAPEFLFALSGFGNETAKVDDDWETVSEPYVIKYKAKIADFEYYTFYEGQEEYLQDYHNKWIGVKKNYCCRELLIVLF